MDKETLRKVALLRNAYRLYKYLLFQPQLAIATLRDWTAQRTSAYTPVPPARLRHRVHGSLDRQSFLTMGRDAAQNIRDLLATVERKMSSFQRVLDFGCGSGRVLRHFLNEVTTSPQLFGTDIDPEAIGWCQQNIPRVHWSINGYMPPTSFQGNTFDLIYANSVFTHLDETFQNAWLGELQRIAQPGGIVLLTVHGEYSCQTMSASVQNAIRSQGFFYDMIGPTGRFQLNGLPDFYQTSFHTEDYIKREWSKYFEVLRIVDRAINDHQEAVLLRKR